MSDIAMQPVESSTIHAIGYDPATKEMRVQFLNGGKPGPIYSYANVPPTEHDAFVKSPSKGKHMHANIKGKFSHRKL